MKYLYALVVTILCSACSTVTTSQIAATPDPAAAQAKPVVYVPPGQKSAAETVVYGKQAKTLKVRSRQRSTNAVYHRAGPDLQLTIPPSENVIPGKSSIRGRGVPGPVDTEKALEGAVVEAWTDTSSAFLSTNFDDNGTYNSGYRFIPPDSHAAAGPLHVLNVVNTTLSIHQKDGTLDLRQSLAGFFATLSPLTSTFDPKVIYDQYRDRWLVVTLEQTDTANGDPADTSRIFLAVSDDANPNGTWYVTEFNSQLNIGGNNYWADYPGFAVGEDAVYITANMFPFTTGGFGGVRLWIVDKGVVGGFYAGGAASFSVEDPYALGGSDVTTQPAHMYGVIPGTTDTYLVGYSGLADLSGTDFIQVVRLDDPLGTPVFTQAYLSLGDVDDTSVALTEASQLGSSALINVNDRRALDAVWINDSLWMTATIRPPAGAVDAGQTTAYWLALDTTVPSSLLIADRGQINGEDIAVGAFTFFPSVAVNGYGDVTIGFSAADDSIYAGAYYVTREAGDAAGTTGTAQTVKAGEDYYIRKFGGTRNRWGDYSATALDPHDGCFWIYNEYAQTRGTIISGEDGRWGTAFARSCNLSHACSDSVSIPAGQWTRFALPCNTAPNNTVADVFSGLAAGDYGNTWVVYRRTASTTPAYVAMTLGEALLEGAGYWVFSDVATTVNLNGTISSLADIDLFGLAGGLQNHIGHTQDAQISWADVQFVNGGDLLTLSEADAAGLISRNMYKWNGAAYEVFNGLSPQIGTLDPFDAFWVKAFASGIKLRIPQASAVSASSAAVLSAAKAPVLARPEIGAAPSVDAPDKVNRGRKGKLQPWYVRLTATSGDMQDPGNLFGSIKGARTRNDINDLEEPAPFGERYLTVLFTNPKLKPVQWGYTSDFRRLKKKPGGNWPFVVKASADVSKVTLSWVGPDFVFEDAWLIDRESGRSLKVHSGEKYTFRMDGAQHRFSFEIGN